MSSPHTGVEKEVFAGNLCHDLLFKCAGNEINRPHLSEIVMHIIHVLWLEFQLYDGFHPSHSSFGSHLLAVAKTHSKYNPATHGTQGPTPNNKYHEQS